MERQFVSSSNIQSIGYDSESETLEVEFKSGGIYHYANVPLTVYEALISAPSVGKFLNAEIKPNYPCSLC